MPRVFICYRREDSAGHAGRLFDHLQRSFDRDVFMDVEGIDGGIDFQEHIRGVVGSCDVLLAVIGQKWLQSRLTEPDDLLRAEIKAALDRNIRVIPLLVDDARFPAGGLPDDLSPLGRRQAMELRNGHWNADVQKLIEVLKRIPSAAVPAPVPRPANHPVPEPTPRPREGQRFVRVAGLAAGCAALALAVLLYPRRAPEPDPAPEPTPAPSAAVTDSAASPATFPSPTAAMVPVTTLVTLPEPAPTLACRLRWSQPSAAGVACGAGEMLAAGGCTCPGGTLRSSYPSPEGMEGVPATAWQCDGQCPNGLKAIAVCCTTAP
jgi:hypothetical protein